MADHKPLHQDARRERDGEGERDRDEDRDGLVGDELLDDEAGIGAHHDEFAMRHVDNAHHAEGDGKPDGGEEVDRGERQRVEAQVGGGVQGHLGLDGAERGGGRQRHGGRRAGVALVEGELVERRLDLGLGRDGFDDASVGERGIGDVAGVLGVQRGELDAADFTAVHVRDQRGALVGAADAGLGEVLRDEKIVGGLGGQRLRADAQDASDVLALGLGLGGLERDGEKRVQRGAHVEAQVALEALDGFDPLLVGFAEADRQQALQPGHPRLQRRIGLVLHHRAERAEMRGVGIALDGGQGPRAGAGLGVAQLELDERGGDQAPDARVGLQLVVVVVGNLADLGAVGEIEDAQGVAVDFLGKDEETRLLVLPHLLGLPFLQHALRGGQPAGRKRVDGGSDGGAGGFLDRLAMLLQQLLDRRGGILGGSRQARAKRAPEKQEQTCHARPPQEPEGVDRPPGSSGQ